MPLDQGARFLVFLRFDLSSLVMRRASSTYFCYELVFLRIPQYCTDHGDLRDWEGVQCKSHTDHRVCFDAHTDPRVDHCFHHDGPSSNLEANSVASDGRG